MKLNYKILGEGQPLIILHGLFGSSDNWLTHAKRLSEYFKVILVDQRNHGHSDWSNDFNYTILATDLMELITELDLNKSYVLGHSMGGKTAMVFAQLFPEMISKLIVVDIGIKQYPMHHDEILKGIHAVGEGKMNSRSDAESQLLPFIPSAGVRQFLMKNLYWKEKEQLAWRMNVAILEKEMPHILASIADTEVFTPALFIRGEQSNYILDEDWNDIENAFPDSNLVTIKNAGHWVHAEAPEVFMNEVLGFLLR